MSGVSGGIDGIAKNVRGWEFYAGNREGTENVKKPKDTEASGQQVMELTLRADYTVSAYSLIGKRP